MAGDNIVGQELPEGNRPPVQEETAAPLGALVLDFMGVITKWRRFISWFIVSSVVLAAVVALLLPKWYKATAVVFPAEQADLFSGLQGVSSLVKTFGGGGKLTSLGRPSETERYLAILKSENALMHVIEKFDLTKVYDITDYPREKTMKELLSNVTFEEGDEGTIDVSVYDKDPQRAAAMANYFLQVLNEINSQLNAQNARGNREFIEQRYNKNLEDMRKAEDALKVFQQKNGVIALPEQTAATIKANAELYGTLAAKEIHLSVMERTLSPDHPSVEEARIEIGAMRKKLGDLNSGTNLSADELKVLVPLKLAPQLAQDYLRLYRDAEIQYKILQFITPLYEQAKVEEQRSTPSVVVLDVASVPERKAKPKVTLYALLALVSSTLVALTVVMIAEGVVRIRTANPQRWATLWGLIRSDWFGLRWKRHVR